MKRLESRDGLFSHWKQGRCPRPAGWCRAMAGREKMFAALAPALPCALDDLGVAKHRLRASEGACRTRAPGVAGRRTGYAKIS